MKSTQSINPFFLAILILLFAPTTAVCLELPVSIDFFQHANYIMARIAYTIPKEYHAYANRPGPSGKPTKAQFTLDGAGQMPITYPVGKPEKDTFDPSLVVNTYSGTVSIFVTLPPDAENRQYSGSISMLLCSRRHCMPLTQSFSGMVPAVVDKPDKPALQKMELELRSMQESGEEKLYLEEGAAPPPKAGISEEARDELPREAPEKDALLKEEAIEPDSASAGEPFPPLQPHYVGESLEIYSFGKAVLLGIIAGLILNAMPCVLPVLTLKVGSLIFMGGMDDARKRREFRIHNFSFAAGILSLFTALALLLGMADKMWGQLYQNEILLLGMLMVIFLMGLSMLGVFALPAFDLHLGLKGSNPALKSYLTGIVSTFLATPCSGPLLGGVLAWAFTQPMPILISIFWSVGLGMGLPYIAFGSWPSLAHILPKPGNWMHVFEKILGFLLLGTAIYLLSILPVSIHIKTLVGLLCAALIAWSWGEFCGLEASRARRRIGAACGIGLLLGAMFWILKPPAPEPEWTTFSAAEFHRNLGRRPMLIEFTADWCPNCKFVEASVFTASNIETWKKKYDLLLVRADLTQTNPAAEQLLEMLGSRSIPLTAVFPLGADATKPFVLRDIYETDTLANTLAKAFH